jgi:hypothetical protein
MQEQGFLNLYRIALKQNAAAFTTRHFGVAHEALEAAMYCACRLRDADRLLEVQQLAEEQGEWIDANAPEHPLSARQAQARGTEPLFAALARQTRLRALDVRVGQPEPFVSAAVPRCREAGFSMEPLNQQSAARPVLRPTAHRHP